MSNYVALYRKYRPKTFKEIIGQEHIVTTLTNQISLGKVSHAYLFTGSRGTGKTSCAKIFARGVNCLKPTNGSPCGKCAACKALDEPNNMDVLEIDAASNNKVDEIREIRERVKYLPVSVKYKVYIIDEVHMLTDSAFNALLKTLEEPPEHVIFILATTEAHKLPATVLSRCMRFDFRLVSVDALSKKLEQIYKSEHKEFDGEAVEYIASAAEGSVRDMLSIADASLNYSDKKLTLGDVLDILGASGKELTGKLFNAVLLNDAGGIFINIDELYKSGKSMSLVAKDLAAYARDLLALKTAGDTLVTDTKENIKKLSKIAENISADMLIHLISEFSKLDSELRYSVNPRILLESAALRAGSLNGGDLNALTERVRRLEEGAVSLKIPATTLPIRIDPPVELPVKTLEAAVEQVKSEDAKAVLGRLITRFRRKDNMNIFTLLSDLDEFSIDKNEFIVTAADERFLRFSEEGVKEEIDAAFSEWGMPFKLTVKKQSIEADMDKEIEKVRRMTGIEPEKEK